MAKKKTLAAFDPNGFVAGATEDKKDLIVRDNGQINPNAIVVDGTMPIEKKKKSKSQKAAVTIMPEQMTSMSYVQDNIPYGQLYNETNKQLDEAISELNMLGMETLGELQQLRASKTLRNKYNYINDMTANATSIITSKISAIKEKNKTIGDIAHLELTRLKELKNRANEEDDNAHIANLYNAFVNTPVGGGMNVLAPPLQELMMPGNARPTVAPIGGADTTDNSGWEMSLDPSQNRMLLEAKNAIETVVMYDDATGNRWFEVLDKQTRQPVPNVEKPSETTLYDLDINIRGGFAKDANRNVVYPLIVLNNGNGSINEY